MLCFVLHIHYVLLICIAQVLEMRHNVAHKDGALHRAAKMFTQYGYYLQQAVYSSQKRTLPAKGSATAAAASTTGNGNGNGNPDAPEKDTKDSPRPHREPAPEVVEIIIQSKEMEFYLSRLSDILKPYINENALHQYSKDELTEVTS